MTATDAKNFAKEKIEGKHYGKALLITGGVVLAVWAARKVPWKKLVDADTLESVKETFASVTERLEDMAREYVNGPVAEAVGNTKKIASRIASSAATQADNATH